VEPTTSIVYPNDGGSRTLRITHYLITKHAASHSPYLRPTVVASCVAIGYNFNKPHTKTVRKIYTDGRARVQWILSVQDRLQSLRYHKQNRQCTYDVTLWRVRVTTSTMESQQCVAYVAEIHVTVYNINIFSTAQQCFMANSCRRQHYMVLRHIFADFNQIWNLSADFSARSQSCERDH